MVVVSDLIVNGGHGALGKPGEVEAGLHDLGTPYASLRLARGWGLHFDRRVALSRAGRGCECQ